MFGICTLAALLAAAPADTAALRLVDLGIEHMGGDALRRLERVRYDMITQWQRTTFDERPYADAPAYETHTDVRDYTIGGWRNTRRAPVGGEWRTIIDLVRDSVAVRDFGTGFVPLNVAYVDERDELFTYSPDRVLLHARAARDLRVGADTTIGGVPHARLMASLGGNAATLFLRRSDGLPTMLRFRAAHPNDFGLVQWGEMDVEVWYSSWRTFAGGISLPTQWDVRRVQRPYKRITVLNASFDPAFAADSFAVADSLRAAYRASPRATRPMHDLPFDSARVVQNDFVEFRTFGGPVGAVRLGGRWLVLEAGQAPLSFERARAWLAANAPAPVAAVIAGQMTPGNGGAAAAVDAGIPLIAGPGAAPILRAVLHGYDRPTSIEAATEPRWLKIGSDSLRLETLDLPDAPGALLAWAPSLRWLYAPAALTPLDVRLVLERARQRGWAVERLGTARGVLLPVPAS